MTGCFKVTILTGENFPQISKIHLFLSLPEL